MGNCSQNNKDKRKALQHQNNSHESILDNVSAEMIQSFLRRNKVYWSGVIYTPMSTLIIPTSLNRILADSNNLIDIGYKCKKRMCKVKIDENNFSIFSEDGKFMLDLSSDWSSFLNEHQQSCEF